MYDCGLWSNLVQLAPFALASCGSEDDAVGKRPSKKRLQIWVMFADAFMEAGEYRKAENLYKESVQLRKQIKVKKSSGDESSEEASMEATSDAEVKFKLHKCHLKSNQVGEAVNALQSIPAKQRSPKCNMALGKLYRQVGMERPAVSCLREVLKACPMSIEAAQILMQLGVKAKEIQELTLDVESSYDWLHQWTQAYACFASRDYGQAATGLKHLEDTNPLLRNNVHLLSVLGQCQHYNGDYPSASLTLQRVHRLDPNHVSSMDILAVLLAKERKLKELEHLATRLMSVTESAPEPWIAMGYYCYANKKGSRAVYFAHKACMLQHTSVEALLLKGNVLLDMKKLQDAMNHFREAVQVAPYRYETHKGLVDCYLAQSRHREAVSVATAACKQGSQRVLTLLATVLAKDPLQLSLAKAKSLLEKALAADPHYLPAVYLLAEILEQEGSIEQAVDLLRKQLKNQSSGKLHQMLADLLAKTHDEEKAMEHYSIALNLDPKNVPAQEGLQKMEQATDTTLDATYDLDMEEINSDNEDLEESETEAVWSDGDLNLASSNVSYGL